jgi:hypothetical protein
MIARWSSIRKRPAFLGRGQAYGYKGTPDTALIDFDEAIALNGNDARTYSVRAAAYVPGDRERVMADHDQSIPEPVVQIRSRYHPHPIRKAIPRSGSPIRLQSIKA